MTEVKRAYIRMRQLYPAAAHVIAAYSFKNNEGNQDDREFGASIKILCTIKQQQTISNVAVFVVRETDSTHIGPKRHILIEKALLEALTKFNT